MNIKVLITQVHPIYTCSVHAHTEHIHWEFGRRILRCSSTSERALGKENSTVSCHQYSMAMIMNNDHCMYTLDLQVILYTLLCLTGRWHTVAQYWGGGGIEVHVPLALMRVYHSRLPCGKGKNHDTAWWTINCANYKQSQWTHGSQRAGQYGAANNVESNSSVNISVK